MTISIPLIALVAVIVYIAYRYLGLRVWHAIVCALLGFLLAATSAAPQIRAFVSADCSVAPELRKGVMPDAEKHSVFRDRHSEGLEPEPGRARHRFGIRKRDANAVRRVAAPSGRTRRHAATWPPR